MRINVLLIYITVANGARVGARHRRVDDDSVISLALASRFRVFKSGFTQIGNHSHYVGKKFIAPPLDKQAASSTSPAS